MMKTSTTIVIALLFTSISCLGQTKKYSFTNEFGNWGRRTDYFNWKVYMIADSTYLASIKQVEYYLDPSFKKNKHIITRGSGGNNFTLCTNGWGEFIIRIKIIFRNSTPSINDTYKLDLHTPARKKTYYTCL